MLKRLGSGTLKSVSQSLLFTFSYLLSINSWSVTGSDISLIDLMIDSYEMKMIAWSDQYAYLKDGPGIDIRPEEVGMHQNMRHLDEYEGMLEQSLADLTLSLQNFSVNWQENKVPDEAFARELDQAQQAFSDFLLSKMSDSSIVDLRAQQINTLLTLSSIYIFMAAESKINFPITEIYNVDELVTSLDTTLSKYPVKDATLLAKWRFLKTAFLRDDYVAPLLVKRHALSTALILQRSLDELYQVRRGD